MQSQAIWVEITSAIGTDVAPLAGNHQVQANIMTEAPANRYLIGASPIAVGVARAGLRRRQNTSLPLRLL
jgi:hypothetical protein